MKHKLFITITFAFTLFCCEKFEYSPYQVLPNEEYQNINKTNISRFINIKTDTITFAVIGDSQRYYDATDDIVNKINNKTGIDFVVHTGDLVDFGLQEEYITMHELLSKLSAPYVAVVGNHDLIGNGGEIYNLMYGNYNFSFIVNGNKFVYINTNSREFNFDSNVPDIQWLDYELSDTSNYNQAIIVSHVSHLNNDFNQNLKNDFLNVLRKYKKVILSINGHGHQFSFLESEIDNISYLNTYSTSNRKYVLLKIWNGDFSYEIIN